MPSKAPVMESVREAVAFARLNVRHVAGVLGLVMLLNVAGDIARGPVAVGLTFLAALLVGLMANAALLRLAVAKDATKDDDLRIGWQGFQFGRPEARLLGAFLLLTLFLLIAMLFLVLLVVIFTIAILVTVHGERVAPTAATKLPPDVQAMVSVLLVIFSVALLWVLVRVCPYPAATVAEKRIQVFSTWRLTAGNGWRIFAAFVLLLSPAIVLYSLMAAFSGQPQLQSALAVIWAGVNAFVEIPLLCGFYAHLYKRLRTPMAAAVPVPLPPQGLAGPWG